MQKKSKHNLEFTIQSTFFKWLNAYPSVRAVTFSIPNGGAFNSIIQAVNQKRAGLTSGVPDVFMALPRQGYHGLFIEFKSSKGKVSIEQQEMLKKLREQQYKCEVCYDFDEAKEVVESYLL